MNIGESLTVVGNALIRTKVNDEFQSNFLNTQQWGMKKRVH